MPVLVVCQHHACKECTQGRGEPHQVHHNGDGNDHEQGGGSKDLPETCSCDHPENKLSQVTTYQDNTCNYHDNEYNLEPACNGNPCKMPHFGKSRRSLQFVAGQQGQ